MEPPIPIHGDGPQPQPDPDRTPFDRRSSWTLFALGLGAFLILIVPLVFVLLVSANAWIDPESRSAYRHVPGAIVLIAVGFASLAWSWIRRRERRMWITPAVFGVVLILVAIARLAIPDPVGD